MIGLNNLVVAAIYCIKRIAQSFKHRILLSVFEHVNGEYTKCSGFPFANEPRIKIPASQLKRMTNKKHMLLLRISRIIIPALNGIQPSAPGNIPIFKAADQGITRTT